MTQINEVMNRALIGWNNLTARTRDEEGQTLVEYGLIIALISIAAIAIMATVGTNIKSVFQKVSNNLS